MQMTLGVLSVKLKHAFRRGGVIYYQRAIPKDLQDRYSAKLIKTSLETDDVLIAKRKIEQLDREVEAEWSLMRGNPAATPKTIKGQAVELLRKHGLSADFEGNDEIAVDLFRDHLDEKRQRYAGGDEVIYREASGSEFLTPVEIKAAQIIAGTVKPTLSEALDLYLETHPNRDNKRFEEHSRLVMKTLTDAVGDKPIDKLSRSDGHKYVAAQIARGVKTGTVSRYMNSIRAIIGSWFREKEIDRANPFSQIPIPKSGEDADKRQPFTEPELRILFDACRSKNDDVRWLTAILGDTGARLAEIAGLALDDLVLDTPDGTPIEMPRVIIRPHPWRPLKTPSSTREVPLMGSALWAAQRIKETANKAQRFAFPRYTTVNETKATHASNTIAKWIRSLKIDDRGMDHTAHELRHTMADRLRDVGCPQEVREAIGGWSSKGIAATYGKGYSLRIMAEWLGKVTL